MEPRQGGTEDLGDGPPVDARFLPDVDRRQVEPEGLDLPDERVHEPLGHAKALMLRKGVADETEIRREFTGPRVREERPVPRRARGRGPARAVGLSRVLQPGADERELPAVRLVRIARENLLSFPAHSRNIAPDRSDELPRGADPAEGRCEVVDLALGLAKVEIEDQVLLLTGGPFGHLGRDGGVPVAVSADPGAEPQERGDSALLVLPRVSAGAAFERVSELLVQARKGREERLAEVEEPVVNLLVDGRLVEADFARLPEGREEGGQFLRDGPSLPGGPDDVLAPEDLEVEAAVLFEDRAPLRFRRVGRHDGTNVHGPEHGGRPGRPDSPPPEARHRGGERPEDPFFAPLLHRPPHLHGQVFLGQVRQREREVEGADDLPERLEVQSPDEADEAPLLRGVEPVAEVAAEVADRPDEPRLAGSRLLFYDAVKDCFKILNVLGKTGGRGRMLWRGFEKAHGSE